MTPDIISILIEKILKREDCEGKTRKDLRYISYSFLYRIPILKGSYCVRSSFVNA